METCENSNTSRTLDELGYHFVKVYSNVEGEISVLRHKEGGKDNIALPLTEAISKALIQYVYEFLEKELELEKIIIPVDAGPQDPKGFFFMSKNALEYDKLMILIQGSGDVRAGLWSRRATLETSFECGTMVPYIKQARQEGFGVVITNGNHNEVSGRSIKGSENSRLHFVHVWDRFIKNAKAEHIVIVAHSDGGKVFLHGLKNIDEAKTRIKAVAFTNSTHDTYQESMDTKRWLKERARDWVRSTKPLDSPVNMNLEDDCCQVSAGTKFHNETSHYAKESVFRFLKEKLKANEIVAWVDGLNVYTMTDAEAAEVIARYMNLDKTSMADPPADVTQKCRFLCSHLKGIGRCGILTELRGKIPSGMTGPLLNDDMFYMEMDFKTRTDLSRALCNREDLWKRLASELNIPGEHFGYYGRKDNPAEAVLEHNASLDGLTVGSLYDVMVRCGACALADKYL